MANQKHLTALDRITIENGLKNNDSFKAIAKKLDKDCTTISKEVKKNLSVRKTGAFGRSFNNCLYRYTCKERYEISALQILYALHLRMRQLCGRNMP